MGPSPSAPPSFTRVAPSSRGFTLVELIIGLVIFGLMAGTVITVLMRSVQKHATASEASSAETARIALETLARDLQAAGLGADVTHATPQPPIAYIDSMEVLIHAGAETVRWTLDLNNDGAVNVTDLGHHDATAARLTPNPYDYQLVREVYGDSTGGIAGDNGPTRDRVGVIKKPCGGTPPLFTVYLAGQDAPWNWANGPVPANWLAEIESIEVTIVATSRSRTMLQNYSDVPLTTTVIALRNSQTAAR